MSTLPFWLMEVRFPYNAQHVQYIKAYPGCTWDPQKRVWIAPIEAMEYITAGIKLAHFTKTAVPVCAEVKLDERLHHHQKHGISKATRAGLRWIFNDEMGLGKSAQALCASTLSKRVLIISPAIARLSWLREAHSWLDGSSKTIVVLDAGAENRSISKKHRRELDEALTADVVICSYGLVSSLPAGSWGCIILDEAHRLKSPLSVQSKAVRSLLEKHPHDAPLLATTATIMPDQPLDCWNLLDLIWPGRFGKQTQPGKTHYAFAARYANKEIITLTSKFGQESRTKTKFVGINAQHGDELRTRLGALSSRTVKADVPDLIPAFHVIPLPISTKGVKLEPWMYFGETNERTISQAKALAAKLAALTGGAGVDHQLCALGHRKEFVLHCAEKIRGAVFISGDIPPAKRADLLVKAGVAGNSIACTIDSVGVAIDLTAWTEVYIAEMHYRPELMIQALGRFSRLSGREPATVYLMIAEGTEDEVIAQRLMNKLDAINKAVRAGDADTKLLAALGGGRTDEENLRDLATYVNSLEPEEETL